MKRILIIVSTVFFLFSGFLLLNPMETQAASKKHSYSKAYAAKSKKNVKRSKNKRKKNNRYRSSQAAPTPRFAKTDLFDIDEIKHRKNPREIQLEERLAESDLRQQDSSIRRTITGVASWYGHKFHRRTTASGEKFDMYALTGAIKDRRLFGKYVRVTNLNNNQSIIVKINDYGPHIKGRVIDLSYGSAQKLGMVQSGLAKVKIEVLNA